jgi:uncharacterized protein (TIGR02598 family)
MPQRPARPHAFSLVEVVVAVAIVALVALPALALLSAAIDASRSASSQVGAARIGAALVGELQQAEWAALDSWHDRQLLFDAEAQPAPADAQPAAAAFTARIVLSPAGHGLALSPSSPTPNHHLRSALVAVSSLPGEAGAASLDLALAASPQPSQDVRVFRTIIVDPGR